MEPLCKNVLGIITAQFKKSLHPVVAAWPQFAYIEFRSAGDAIRRVAQHCHEVRTMLRNQQRNVHQRAANTPSFQICGGAQLFLDISRAFDEIPRQPLFDHLRTLSIDQNLVSILGQWHSQTAYITQHGTQFQESMTGCGIRQGCRAAPVLWTGFTNLIFEKLSDEIEPTWIKKAVTIYADDIHSGDVLYSERELTQLLSKFGKLLDVIERHGLTISLSKSMLLISFGGTNYRRLQNTIIQKGDQGYFVCIPRAGGRQSRLTVQKIASYLGVQMSYTTPEMQTLQHRMSAAKKTFFRLRRWLRTRAIKQQTKLHLWHSCIYTTLIYGLFATNFTFSGLYKLNTFILNNLRQVTGNYSFQTGLTHAQFLHQYNLQHPFAMLMHSLTQLRRLQCQRLTHLTHTDILHTVDLTNLHCLETLIQTAWNAQDRHMDQPLPTQDEAHIRYFSCNWCLLRFDSLPNLRRHQTQVHGFTQLRTHEITVASHALNGLPSCVHCHKTFTTWRRFIIHLERNCCQACPSTTSSTLERQQQDADTQWLTSTNLTLLLSKPYGAELLQAVVQGQWAPMRALAQAHEDLCNHCILCGVYHGRPQELNMHIRSHHRKFVANIFAKAAQLGRSQASISPCFFCHKTFLRQHQCPFWTQIALLIVNMRPTGDAALSDFTLRCEVCRKWFGNIMELHTHLFSDHKLEIQDWLPTRDLLGADPVCSHCLSCFADRAAVRHHITRGLCQSFDAAKPIDEMPVSPTWTNIIITGDMDTLKQSPMMRLSMTLHCQLCGVRFERQQDLAQHLQTDHADRWMRTQTTLHLLMQVGHLDTPCICNPQTHSRGVSHVCPAYRQLSMLAQRVDHELFLPWKFDPEGVRLFLASVQNHAVIETILTTLANRQFSDLWMNQCICHLLRNTCLICGGTFHPAVLCEHVKAMHYQECTWIPEILPQLLPAFQTHQTCDFQCKSCELIFNLPASPDCTLEHLRAREQLVQIHAQHHCPIVYQVCLLLTHGLPSRARGHDYGGCGDSRSLQSHGTSAAERQVPQRSKRRKRCQKDQERTSASELPTAPGRDQIGAHHGQHDPTIGCRKPTDEKARLLRLLSSKRRTCTSPPIDVESEGVAFSDATAATIERGTTTVCAPEERSVSGPGQPLGESSSQAFHGRSERCSPANSPDSRGDHGGGLLSLSAMELTATNPDTCEEGAHCHEPHVEVHGTAQTDLPRPDSGPEVPCAETGRRTPNCTVDPPDRHSTRRTPSPARTAARIHGLGPHRCDDETPHANPEPTRARTSTTSGQGQREADRDADITQRSGQEQDTFMSARITPHQLRAGFETMILLNLENWCYANTALLTLTWALLSCTAFAHMDWGPLEQNIVRFLQSASQMSYHLPDADWFQNILHSWTGEGEQCDPVEFLTHLIQGIQLPGLDWTWERRVQLGTETSVRDKSDRLTPVTLHLDPEMSHDGWIRLDTMIHNWHNYMGMNTALCGPTPLLCFHVDRHVMAGTGETYKSDLSIGMHGVFSIPFFTDSSTKITWEDFRVVAAISHLGSDQAGHCRAILRVQASNTPGHEPYMHLLTDDNAVPTRCWKEPSWFLQNIMCIWMCHVDSLDLHQCTQTNAESADPPTTMNAIMELLNHF